MYVNRYNELNSLELIGEEKISTRLKDENITIKSKLMENQNVSYISGKTKQFKQAELSPIQNQHIKIKNDTELEASMIRPIPLGEITEESLTNFVAKNLLNGSSYKLWKINKKANEATFFQSAGDHMIYYNQNAVIKIYWNNDLEITGYKQTMFDSLKSFGEKYTLITTQQAIKSVFDKGYLTANSTITTTELGYSTLVPLTETQVLSPTWYIHIEYPKEVDGEKKEADYFVNAVDGTIVDIEQNAKVKDLEKQ